MTDDVILYKKGSEVDVMVHNLIDCAYDKDAATRECMEAALIKLGINEPKLVLSFILQFLKKHFKSKKVPVGHHTLLLNCISKIISEAGESLCDCQPLIVELVKHIYEEMTAIKDSSDLHKSASQALVSLSTNFCEVVLEILIQKISPGLQPHPLVMQTLGDIAANNPSGMFPYLGDLLTQMLTFIGLIKQDSSRLVFAITIGQFCEAVMENRASFGLSVFSSSEARSPSSLTPVVGDPAFSSNVYSTFKILYTSWINTKNSQLRSAVICAIGQMLPLIDRNTFESQLSPLLQSLISLYKKQTVEAYQITRTIASLLQIATSQLLVTVDETDDTNGNDVAPSASSVSSAVPLESVALKHEFDVLLVCLFNQFCVPLNDPTNQAMLLKNHNEVKRCFAILCDAFSDRVLSFLMTKLENHSSPDRVKESCLIMLRHLVSCCNVSLSPRRALLVMSLRSLIISSSEGTTSGRGTGSKGAVTQNRKQFLSYNPTPTPGSMSNGVRLHFAQTVMAMAGQGYLSLEGGQTLVEFIVAQCTLIDPEEKGTVRSSGGASNEVGRSDMDTGVVTNSQLRRLCENVLLLGTNTVEGLRSLLWPYLLEFLIPPGYTEAVWVICSALTRILEHQEPSSSALLSSGIQDTESEDDLQWIIDFDEQVNIPKPHFLIARLVVLAGCPMHGNRRGLHILKAMQVLSYNLHENLHDIWTQVIPMLIGYCERAENSNESSFDQNQWEDLLLKMLARSIEQVCDEEWTQQLGEAFAEHIPLYDAYPEEKGFLFKCMGVVMANMTQVDFLNKHLDIMCSSVRHVNRVEREGCALSLGTIAGRHLELVLTKLEILQRQEELAEKKALGVLGLLKDKEMLNECRMIRSTLLLTYGHVIFMADPEVVPFRLEMSIMPVVLAACKKAKDLSVKQSLIQCLELIGRSVHPSHLGSAFHFKGKSEILDYLLGFMKLEPIDEVLSETRVLIMKAVVCFIRLEPAYTERELKDIVQITTDAVYPLPSDGVDSKRCKELSESEAENLRQLTGQTLDGLNQLLVAMMVQFLSDAYVTHIFKILLGRIESLQVHERQRSLETLHVLLVTFQNAISDMETTGTHLSSLGLILGHLMPRVTDSSVEVRCLALNCINTVLQIDSICRSGRLTTTPFTPSSLTIIKERLTKFSAQVPTACVADIATVVVTLTPFSLLPDLLDALYVSLTDSQHQSVMTVCTTLDILFSKRAADLADQVNHIMCVLHDEIQAMNQGPGRAAALRSVRNLAVCQTVPTLNTVMAQTLPLDTVWCEMLVALCYSKPALDRGIDHLSQLLYRATPFEEREDPRKKGVKLRLPCHSWLAGLNCLQVFCRIDTESHNSLLENYSRLLAIWIIACSSAVTCHTFEGKSFERKTGSEAKLGVGIKPASIPIEGLHNFLMSTGSHDIIEEMAAIWSSIDTQQGFLDSLVLVAKGVCESPINRMSTIVNHLLGSITSINESQRIAVIVFYGSIIRFQNTSPSRSSTDEDTDSLVEVIVSHLLKGCQDPSPSVRSQALIGLGNTSYLGSQVVTRRANTLLAALLEGMDGHKDPEHHVSRASMCSLSLILPFLSPSHLQSFLVPLSLHLVTASCDRRLKDESAATPAMRALAFRLLGQLARFAEPPGPLRQAYLDQTDHFLVPMLLHTGGKDVEVQKACSTSLMAILPLVLKGSVSSDSIVTTGLTNGHPGTPDVLDEGNSVKNEEGLRLMEGLVKRWLKEDQIIQHMDDFFAELSKILVNHVPNKVVSCVMKCIFYFRSDCPLIQSNSVMLTGLLLSNLPDNMRQYIQKDNICEGLIHLLRDSDFTVRTKAAEAIGLLHMY